MPFLSAFWGTMIIYYSSIPSLRLDKYLYLIRQYVAHSFIYLSDYSWPEDMILSWVELMQGRGDFAERGALSPSNGKVADGLKYHICDVWVDGLVQAKNWKVGMEGGVMKPVEDLASGGLTKSVRERAKTVLQDKKLMQGGEDEEYRDRSGSESNSSEFEGFGE